MTAILEREQVANAYGRWAPVYDMIFGPVFPRGRLDAVAAAERIGDRTLEVGVGTGLSLRSYSSGSHWAQGAPGVRLPVRRALPPLGHFALIRFLGLREPLEYDATAPAKTAVEWSRNEITACQIIGGMR